MQHIMAAEAVMFQQAIFQESHSWETHDSRRFSRDLQFNSKIIKKLNYISYISVMKKEKGEGGRTCCLAFLEETTIKANGLYDHSTIMVIKHY